MPIITLTTDWGLRDHYVASFKGELISCCNDLTLVDISHEIKHFDILEASFVIRNCFEKFPKNTLHYIGVTAINSRANKNEKQNFLIVKCHDHLFTGSDSGIFSLILGDAPKEIFKLPVSPHATLAEVHDLFLLVARSFANGESITEMGTPSEELIQSYHTRPTVEQSAIRGSIIYIDSFDNIISNVTKELFDDVGNGRPFTIFLRKSEYDVHKIHHNYFDAEAGEIVALFNQEGFLKLSINQGKASGLLGMKMMDTIRIEFDSPAKTG